MDDFINPKDIKPNDINPKAKLPSENDLAEIIAKINQSHSLKQSELKASGMKPTDPSPSALKPTDINPNEVNPFNIEPTNIEPPAIKPTHIKRTNIKSTDIEPTNIAPTDINPTAITPTKIKPKAAIKPDTPLSAFITAGILFLIGGIGGFIFGTNNMLFYFSLGLAVFSLIRTVIAIFNKAGITQAGVDAINEKLLRKNNLYQINALCS